VNNPRRASVAAYGRDMSSASRQASFVARLTACERFVDAAALVCESAREIGARHCAVVATDADGRVALAIDNVARLRDQRRTLALGAEDAAATFGSQHAFDVPVVGTCGRIATIVFAVAARCPPALERELCVLATHLSVWCATRGVGAVTGPAVLSPQQHRIARLAARGLFNLEIARELGISINTVKLRLKQMFERLGVDNRVELGLALHGLAAPDEVPPGITRLATATVTRAAAPRPRARSPGRR